MVNLKRILFPTDFSEYAMEAEEYACALARQSDAELHVLSIIDVSLPLNPAWGAPLYLADGIDPHKVREQTQIALEARPNPEWSRGLTIHRAVRNGNPFVEIIRYAREQNIDLIVLGTHGRTGLSHVLLGSVAERVARQASCPVLTARPKTHKFVMP